ncbi:hypothetical protein GALMADRAFT_235341 [Galerina marginata CBS 339.88]|uniref:F-box domain-containing protein n=1 Tax=Galerina marginata (strain CBS 339.88) TaxID=685588 RepID=A0A067TSF6_GALM3|nr:hypothetical protein GALMADRAFT_235341 [Galerina marginata CBS 339.88]
MEETATSPAPTPGNDLALTDLPQNPTTRRRGTRTKIEHYFANESAVTRPCDTSSAADASSSPSQDISQNCAPPKKFKITAGNGRDVVIRQPERKKVKKEVTVEDTVEDAILPVVPSVRRHNARAKLRMLSTFPLDVVFEIFSHLHPSELLHLSRTTKDMRSLVLHRSASYIWRAVLSNVPALPVCPEDVSLPVWASLIFDSFCQSCLAPNVRTVNFRLRVRYCNRCMKAKSMSESVLTPMTNKLHAIILQAVPFSPWNDRDDKFCLIKDKELFVKELDAVEGDRTAFVDERKSALKIRLQHANECKKWFDDILTSREVELDLIRSMRKLMIRQKLYDLGYHEELEFLDNLENYVCAIRPWPTICTFSNYGQVKLPKPLTEKSWARIEGDMELYMKEARSLVAQNRRSLLERRRRIAFHTAYVNWRHKPANLKTYPADMLMPGPADVLEWPSIQSFITEDDDEEYDAKAAMLVIKTLMPVFIASWRYTVLHNLWRKAYTSNPMSPPFLKRNFVDYEDCLPQLQLAAVVFRCIVGAHWRYDEKRMEDDGIWIPGSGVNKYELKDNIQPCLWYPHFFFHPCHTMERYTYDEERTRDNKNLSIDKQYPHYRRSSFKLEHLEFDDKASRIVKNLLDAAELSYDSTTVQDMDTLDQRFVCLKCSFGGKCDGSRRVRVWSWRDAVQHCFKSHFGDSRIAWECILPEDAEKARKLQTIEHSKRGYLSEQDCKVWKCMRCRDTSSDHGRMKWTQLKNHFRNNPKHGEPDKMDDKEGLWYYKALDYSGRELPPVKIIPASTAT